MTIIKVPSQIEYHYHFIPESAILFFFSLLLLDQLFYPPILISFQKNLYINALFE